MTKRAECDGCSGRDEDGNVVPLCLVCVRRMQDAEARLTALAPYGHSAGARPRRLAPEGKTLRDVFPPTTRRYGS